MKIQSRNPTAIEENFINLDINKVPLSIYLVRKSILGAVRKNAHLARGTVVDLGCGEMPYKNEFQNKNTEKYIGIDLSGNKYHNQVQPNLIWDGKTIPLADQTVDFLIATEFLEHYFDTTHILSEIRRVLKPKSKFFFAVPHIWPIHEPPYDYHRFTPFTLDRSFAQAGFSDVKIEALGGSNYFLGTAIELWSEMNLSGRKSKILHPLIKRAVLFLAKRDKAPSDLTAHQIFSGLYGLGTK